jgi:hypothetical protein
VNGTNVTDSNACAPQADIEKFVQQGLWNMVWLAHYFDEDEFEANPIKYEINVSYLNGKTDQAFAQAMFVQKTYVTMKDSWISNSLDNKED